MNSSRGGRPARDAGSVTSFPAGVTAAQDILRGVGGSVLEVARRWTDPRARLLRKRRRARRRATWFGSASGIGVVGTASLAAAAAPDWTMIATGGAAALFAVPAVVAVGTYRRLRSAQLPPPAPLRSTRPPQTSAARAPMDRLARADRSLYELLGVLGRSGAVEPAELEHIGATAQAASSALHAVAVDLVALETAGSGSPGVAKQLEGSIGTARRHLEAGVDQFEELVSAAAKLTSAPAGSWSIGRLERQRTELSAASDRLDGWAAAWGEIGEIDRRFR